jgi:hypothetical protein
MIYFDSLFTKKIIFNRLEDKLLNRISKVKGNNHRKSYDGAKIKGQTDSIIGF